MYQDRKGLRYLSKQNNSGVQSTHSTQSVDLVGRIAVGLFGAFQSTHSIRSATVYAGWQDARNPKFQSTHSIRSAKLVRPASPSLPSYFNPHTHTECDLHTVVRHVEPRGILIHALTRSATSGSLHSFLPFYGFQFTHSHGVRRILR